jgi:hypothetical protein
LRTGAQATKQSILPLRGEMDCFALLAMTIATALLSLVSNGDVMMAGRASY